MTAQRNIEQMQKIAKDYDEAFTEAKHLVIKLHERHYGHVIGWRPAEDLTGLVVQINQMTHGLVKAPRRAA
ncbi:hypothetical protein [Paremcibacter congregatus]|uniref:hypothetical protein n=1 Tax=Paremcibacter congregatus TaxID=2043170 RepID=UPI003A94838E